MLNLYIATAYKGIDENYCGDVAKFWIEKEKYCVLIVADGLGKGKLANYAGLKALEFIKNNFNDAIFYDLELLKKFVDQLNHDSRDTRGCAIGIMYVDFKSFCLRYVGIGNIRCKIINQEDFSQINFRSNAGIIGCNYTSLFLEHYAFEHQNYVIFLYSDGLPEEISCEEFICPQNIDKITTDLLDNYTKQNLSKDDRLLLICNILLNNKNV